ncbi:hypothetical protein FYL25_08915 [Lactobacillus salivarius]|uniref:Surface layer protein A domain-containing protein n=1 Tax=Ligilactobacillus salivarius TaxID=1624 RepID=A0A6N9ISZ7_9LACO|nr:hypothetical protein [Ligilactobacillus salivarius]MYY65506.1 hypothetical protein [Ligilactobacillus salivarius]
MDLYKKLLVVGVSMMAGFLLNSSLNSGVSASITNDNSIASSRISYQKAKKENKHNKVYKLAFFESRTTYDDEHLYYTIGYYSHGKVAYKNVSTKWTSDQFIEVIQADLDTPYVVKTDQGWYIHRPPYSMLYNSQEANISGKVSDKSE